MTDKNQPKWLKALNIQNTVQEKLILYVELLMHFNKNINLISRKSSSNTFCWNMVLDSFLASQLILERTKYSLIADIGSGNGLPGLILALQAPKKKIILFEPNQKKAEFLQYCLWKMDLKNAVVLKQKVQEHKLFPLKCGVSKAFLSLTKRLKITSAVFEKQGEYYHFCTNSWKKDWNKAPKLVRQKWQAREVKKYSYPPFLSERMLLCTRLL